MKLKLHSVRHDNKSKQWCGPSAISAVTGRSTSDIHQCIRAVTNKKCVMGLYVWDMKKALTALGVSFRHQYHSVPAGQTRDTFAKWLREHKSLYAHNPVILVVSNHYVTVMGNRFVDSFEPKPVSLKNAPWRRARVHEYLVIESLGAPTWAPQPQAKKDWKAIAARGELLRKGTAVGIHWDQHIAANEWFVYPPESHSTEELDPHYGDHLCIGAEERAQRVSEYLEIITGSKNNGLDSASPVVGSPA